MICPFDTKRRWTRRKEARPQELLDAALDLFVERGYAATRLDDVAAQAGVSKGTLYLYFTNKEELFKAVVRESMVPVLSEAEKSLDQYEGTGAELLREFIHKWWQRIGETKLSGITKLIWAESGNFPEVAKFYQEEVISRVNVIITQILERGIKRGEYRNIDVNAANPVIVAPIIMLMMWKHSFQAFHAEQISPQNYLNCFIDLLLRGLLTDASQSLTSMDTVC